MFQLFIIAIYSLAIIGIGVWSRKRAGSHNGFFVANRKGTLPLITGSLLATAIGGSVTVGMAGLGFGQGLTGAWWLLVGSVGLVILGGFFAKKVRGAALYTLPELVERQYGPRVGLAASILIVIAWIGVVAGQIVAAGKVLSILGIGSVAFWMIIFTAVFVAYTMLGGQYSVIHTDVIQAIILFVGILVTFGLVFFPSGWNEWFKVFSSPGLFLFSCKFRIRWEDAPILLDSRWGNLCGRTGHVYSTFLC